MRQSQTQGHTGVGGDAPTPPFLISERQAGSGEGPQLVQAEQQEDEGRGQETRSSPPTEATGAALSWGPKLPRQGRQPLALVAFGVQSRSWSCTYGWFKPSHSLLSLSHSSSER